MIILSVLFTIYYYFYYIILYILYIIIIIIMRFFFGNDCLVMLLFFLLAMLYDDDGYWFNWTDKSTLHLIVYSMHTRLDLYLLYIYCCQFVKVNLFITVDDVLLTHTHNSIYMDTQFIYSRSVNCHFVTESVNRSIILCVHYSLDPPWQTENICVHYCLL